MKLVVFQSDGGDSLLLESSDGKNILIDGGMASSYTKFVEPFLGSLRDQRKILDLVYISHIDQDHVQGILKMLDNEFKWRVYDYKRRQGLNPRKPKSIRPPEILEIWHNAFHEQIGDNAGYVEEMLAANAALYTYSENKESLRLARIHENLVASERQAVMISRRIGKRQLNIPLNSEWGGKLMMCKRTNKPIEKGALLIEVIGPFAKDMELLRDQWNKWLESEKGRNQLSRIRNKAEKDREKIGMSEFDQILDIIASNSNQLGNRKKVTTPNLASLMLYIEDGDSSILLTGDGHSDDAYRGLKVRKLLREDGSLHVSILKSFHHGSEYNTKPDFCRDVTADHYVFCGDGSHHNPDIRILKMIIASRVGSDEERSQNPETKNPFKIWFNSSRSCEKADQEHMKKLEEYMSKVAEKFADRISYEFLSDDSFQILV